MRCSPEGQSSEISQCQHRPPFIHGTCADLPPPDRRNLKVHQLRCGQPFPTHAGACPVTIGAVITKRSGQDAGINDDHDRPATPPPLLSGGQSPQSGLPPGRGPRRG